MSHRYERRFNLTAAKRHARDYSGYMGNMAKARIHAIAAERFRNRKEYHKSFQHFAIAGGYAFSAYLDPGFTFQRNYKSKEARAKKLHDEMDVEKKKTHNLCKESSCSYCS